ncbi:hypothetical protein [Rufibacter quisquiliarum]|uniref:Uncharacterized protein n=1 Tax=Rufibacter quisquiliarum TaxID=1549639 RepID=A0A839GAX6_9BACT|nr:hypothetical protein [Rufibacter quisquiliarum]MBA9076082.1 hypothetical protein [Rufibacter quisquiliarum]
MQEQELQNLLNSTFRDEGTDAHNLKGPTKAAEARTFFSGIISWAKVSFATIAALGGKENTGVAQQLINELKGDVPIAGNTLAKLHATLSTLSATSAAEQEKVAAIQVLLYSNDLTLDTVQEIVAYIKANKSLIDSVTTNKLDKSIYDAFLQQYAQDLAGKEPALPAPTTSGWALFWNGVAKVWAPVTATATGGTGAVQVASVNGTSEGNPNLIMDAVNKLLTLGVGWKFKINSTVSRITALPGKTMEFIFSDGLAVAAVFKSVTGKVFLFFRTSGDQAVIVGEAFDHNANIGMTSKKRMGAVATASATKTYFKIPDGSADIQMNIANNGNNITGRMVFIGRSETQYIKVIMEVSAFKTGGVITVDNQVARTTSLGSSITATCGIEATGDNMGIKVFVTPGVASALDWTLYNDYLDI